MRSRVRALVASALSAVFVLFGFYLPTGSASAVVPLLATVPCVGSSLCSPAAPAILAELAAQNGGAAVAGAGLSAAEAGSFSGLVAGYGATATTSGTQIVAAASAAGSAGSALPFVGAAVGLTAGGVAAWKLQGSGSTAGLPGGTTNPYWASVMGATITSLTFTQGTGLTGNMNINYTLTTAGVEVSGASSINSTTSLLWRCKNTSTGATVSSGNSPFYLQTAAQAAIDRAPKTYTGTIPNCGQNASVAVTPYVYLQVTRTGFTNNNGTYQYPSVPAGSNYTNATTGLTTTSTAPATVPNRWIEQTISCTNRAGTTTTVTNSTAAAGWTGSQLVEVAGLMCPTGSRASAWSAKVKTDGGADTALGSKPSYPPDPNPDSCGYVGDTLCIVRLERYDPTTRTWLSCHTGVIPCAKWAEDPTREQTYRCRYGQTSGPVVTVGLGICSIYVDSFPADPVADPPVISDPSPLPNPQPAGVNCDLSWSDFLSGVIVFKAVGCALAWAFVPSETVLSQAQTDVTGAWSSTAPGQITDAASAVYAPLRDLQSTPEADCLGPHVNWTWIAGLTVDAYPFSTCDDFRASLAGYFKPILGAVLLLSALGQSVRLLAGTINLPTTRTVA